MKNDKAAMPKSKQSQSSSGKNATGKNAKGKVTDNDSTTNPSDKARPKSGSGLANEGTVVSYDEQR